MSTETPTDRSMPPEETTKVTPSATMARRTTLFTSTLRRLPSVRNASACVAKTRNRPKKATRTATVEKLSRSFGRWRERERLMAQCSCGRA